MKAPRPNVLKSLADQTSPTRPNKRRAAAPPAADVWATLIAEWRDASDAARAAGKRRDAAAEALRAELRQRALAAGASADDLDAKRLPDGHPVRAILESIAIGSGAGDVFLTLIDKREFVVEARTDRVMKYRPPAVK